MANIREKTKNESAEFLARLKAMHPKPGDAIVLPAGTRFTDTEIVLPKPRRRFLIEATELEMRVMRALLQNVDTSEQMKAIENVGGSVTRPNLRRVVDEEDTVNKLGNEFYRALGDTAMGDIPYEPDPARPIQKTGPFQVGERVRLTRTPCDAAFKLWGPREGMYGTVRTVGRHEIGVEFDRRFESGHDLGRKRDDTPRGKDGHGWFVVPGDLVRV